MEESLETPMGLRDMSALLGNNKNTLSWSQFQKIMGAIDGVHGFYDYFNNKRKSKWRSIKYVQPYIDLRDNRIYRIKFLSLGPEKIFSHTDNHQPSMFDEIMAWLNEPDDKD